MVFYHFKTNPRFSHVLFYYKIMFSNSKCAFKCAFDVFCLFVYTSVASNRWYHNGNSEISCFRRNGSVLINKFPFKVMTFSSSNENSFI